MAYNLPLMFPLVIFKIMYYTMHVFLPYMGIVSIFLCRSIAYPEVGIRQRLAQTNAEDAHIRVNTEF